jgi:hypothetical protein
MELATCNAVGLLEQIGLVESTLYGFHKEMEVNYIHIINNNLSSEDGLEILDRITPLHKLETIKSALYALHPYIASLDVPINEKNKIFEKFIIVKFMIDKITLRRRGLVETLRIMEQSMISVNKAYITA